jgi:hypothetical protein
VCDVPAEICVAFASPVTVVGVVRCTIVPSPI